MQYGDFVDAWGIRAIVENVHPHECGIHDGVTVFYPYDCGDDFLAGNLEWFPIEMLSPWRN